eukprot:scaffold54191_cov45-Attheya_sp.AAC.4
MTATKIPRWRHCTSSESSETCTKACLVRPGTGPPEPCRVQRYILPSALPRYEISVAFCNHHCSKCTQLKKPWPEQLTSLLPRVQSKSKVPSYLAKRMRRQSDLPLPNVHIKSAANNSGSPLKKKGILEKGKLVGICEVSNTSRSSMALVLQFGVALLFLSALCLLIARLPGLPAQVKVPAMNFMSDKENPRNKVVKEGSASPTENQALPLQCLERSFAPLVRLIDREKFTIQMNSWKRNEALEVSVGYLSKCKGTHQIQVVWCDEQGESPEFLLANPKVVIEHHKLNSFNERFNVITEPDTKGILSIDDDIIYPCCEALDNAFFRWVHSLDLMVTFQPHGVIWMGPPRRL